MSNNQPPLNRSIFNPDPLLSNTGDSPFPDPDQHSLFNPNFSPAQPRMMNGMGQIPPSGVHDINSLLSNQHNQQSYNPMQPKPLGAGPMNQAPITLNAPIFPQQPQLPPLNINPQPPMPPYPGAGINQMQPQNIQLMQMMQPNYNNMPNTYNMDYFRYRMQTNASSNVAGAMQPNLNKQDPNQSMMRLLMQRQKPLSPHMRQRSSSSKKFVSDDNEEELIDDIPSSDEATFSGSTEDTDFENLPDDYVPTDVTQRRTAGRENRKTVQRDDDEVYIDDDEEESSEQIENEITHEDLLERIYMTRIAEGGIEYLVRFQDSPKAICSWVPEVLVNGIFNAKSHLERFRAAPFQLDDIPEDSNYLVPVAHRRDTPDSKPELLFRFNYDNMVLFYWDFGSEEVTKNYFNNRLKINATNPPVPSISPNFDEQSVKSKRDKNSRLLPYQVNGVKYLIQSWNEQHGSILADEMGLKKKVQLLSFLNYLNKNTEWHGPFLIACRQSKFQQWSSEIENWTDLRCLAYTSGPDQRNLMREYQFPALDDLGNSIQETYAFNVFLVSYDILIKDIDFISKYNWEVFVVDEWQHVKNKNGKRFNAISKIRSHHNVVLTNRPIQNSLDELWTLLQFVSPTYFQESSDFLDSEVDELTPNQIKSLRDKVAAHILFRTLQEVKDQDPELREENSVHKDEKVAFVSITQYQKDLIRLAKLHKLWRLKGYQTGSADEEMDQSRESSSILKICSHPFLIPDAERYYANKLKDKRTDLLLNVSSKFQFLDHILVVLKHLHHRVIIFSKHEDLLKLINEFCVSRNYPTELIINTSTDSESSSEIDKFTTDDSETFIYLLSSHLGSEGTISIDSPTTVMIFDPDWNPHDDINCLRPAKGKEQEQLMVNVIRIVSFQTFEHDVFLRSQKKLGIWLTILGIKTLEELNQPKSAMTPIRPPPSTSAMKNLAINDSYPLDQALDLISSVVRNFSIDSLDSIRNSLRMTPTNTFYTDVLSDEHFLEQFPLSDATSRRAKRNHSRDLLLDLDSSNRIYDLMLGFGYGEWNRISAELPEHSSEQIRRFCICLTIFAFRAMPPSNITYLPVLAKKVLSEEPDFEFNILLCSNKHTWAQVFPEDHDYALEVDSCKKLKDKLHEKAFSFLSVIEMRLIAKCWSNAFPTQTFDIGSLSPPVLEDDEKKYIAITEYGWFDPFNLRVQAIINRMRSDLITAQLSEEYAETFSWWTGIEFHALVSVLKNYKYDPNNMIEFHSRTAIMSKTTYQVKIFVTRFIKMLRNRQKGSLTLPKDMHMMPSAPKTLQNAKGFTSWVNILVRECEDLSYRKELIELIEKKISEIPDSPEPAEGWGDYHTKKFLTVLLQHGIDSLTDLLQDRRYEFKKFLTQSDLDFLNGKKKRRNLATSQLPDFVFNEEDLYSFVRGELDPFAQDDKDKGAIPGIESGYSNGEDGNDQTTITYKDYQFSTDDEDEASVVAGRKGQYAFEDDAFSTSENETQSDEEQDDFRPDEE
ncbi:hypothetical protein M9Y10_021550 [Tritrichomonas musculus]|uniref:SNF2 family N-terminal domain containing protein n=1 Tax=Tritrichomonas musculus TaxID=1915356 RepID=A0ABR2KT45_9EUKA